jgi:hypothetical protein
MIACVIRHINVPLEPRAAGDHLLDKANGATAPFGC